MPSAGRVETEREAQHRDYLYDRWKDAQIKFEMEEERRRTQEKSANGAEDDDD